MFGLMGGKRLAVESSGVVGLEEIRRDGVRGRPDVSALASLRDGEVCVLAWHHHDDDVPGPDAAVELSLTGLPGGATPVLLEHFRIDRDHSNAFEAWKRMGAPQNPTPEQFAELERSSTWPAGIAHVGPARGRRVDGPVHLAARSSVVARALLRGR